MIIKSSCNFFIYIIQKVQMFVVLNRYTRSMRVDGVRSTIGWESAGRSMHWMIHRYLWLWWCRS